MEAFSDAALATLAGLGGGAILGLAARIGRFCTLGAIEDALYGNDMRRARMWGVALFISILGIGLLEAWGQIDLQQTVYARTSWNPLASIFGGALFGYGMALAGNCGFGALARAAGGEIRSLIIAGTMGVAAYMTLAGPIAPLRLALFPVEPGPAPQSIAHLGAHLFAVPPWLTAMLIAAAFLAWALRSSAFRHSGAHVFWGAAVGLAIVLGWWSTAHLAQISFDAIALESHTFTSPLGESLLYLMTSAGGEAGFSVGSVAGVLIGGILGSVLKGHFHWEACDDPRELGRQVLGAIFMGVGGVIALGCSIGQGLTAFSTLAWSAPVVVISIIAGAVFGLKQLIEGPIDLTVLWSRPSDR